MGDSLYNLDVSKVFLTQNSVAVLKKMNKLYYIKKKFALQNYVKEKMKIWEKTTAVCSTNKRLVSLLYKELKVRKKKAKLTEKGQNT